MIGFEDTSMRVYSSLDGSSIIRLRKYSIIMLVLSPYFAAQWITFVYFANRVNPMASSEKKKTTQDIENHHRNIPSFFYLPVPPSVDEHMPIEARDVRNQKADSPLRTSVIIPGLANGAFEEFSPVLQSIKKQTEAPDDVAIVISGLVEIFPNNTESSNGKEYGEKWCREFYRHVDSFLKEGNTTVHLMCTGIKLPPGIARNYGARMASGDIFLFIDSDDEMLPQRLQVARNVFKCQPSLKVFLHSFLGKRPTQAYFSKHNMTYFRKTGDQCAQDEEGIPKLVNHDFFDRIKSAKEKYGHKIFGQWYPKNMAVGHIVVHRSVFDDIKYNSMARGEDQIFILQILYSFWADDTVLFLDRPLTSYYRAAGRGRKGKS